jgi:hypothetical protein
MLKMSLAGLLFVFLTACSSMNYSLEGVGFPVQANARQVGDGEAFSLKSKYVMYVHGLMGEKQPQVAALLQEHCRGAKAVSGFRVSSTTSLWDWLGTHLSLGFVRLKTVYVSGTIHR